jgi:hypothetical protein|tara:strand:+ start:1436 stop:1753 length:318 start_codon:yes stop_codon:yes gene_type:complete
MNLSSIFRGLFLAAIIFIGVRAEYNNSKLDKRLRILEEGIYYNTTVSDNTAMKFETFLQALSNELPIEVEAYATEAARKVAREVTIDTLEEFAENLKKVDVKLDK